MAKKTYLLDLGKRDVHNCIILNPVASIEFNITSIFTTDISGVKTELLQAPITLNRRTAVRYPSVVSSAIGIVVDNHFTSTLDLVDFLTAKVQASDFSEYGKIESAESRLNFGTYLNIVSDIDDMKDAFVNATIGISTYSRFNDHLYSGSLVIGLNDDGEIAHYVKDSSPIVLAHEPIDGSVKIIISGDYTTEFTVSGNIVDFSLPAGETAVVVYKPLYLSSVGFTDITREISANYNREIKLINEKCDYIIYNCMIEVINSSLTLTNHTPVIKSIAIVSSL